MLGLVEQLTYPLIGISGVYQSVISNKSILNKFIVAINKDRDLNYDKCVSGLKKRISLNNVSFSYDKNKVLDKFNYKFEKGKKYLIRGESGRGKTTLLNILSKMEKNIKVIYFLMIIDMKKLI